MSAEQSRPAHSPLGASGAERWMNCPGSVELIKLLGFAESDEPEYRTHGTAAHELLAHCLTEGQDAWENTDQPFNGIEVSVEMADAVQVFLDEVRMLPRHGRQFIEYRISSPAHPLFYGTLDHAIVDGTTAYVNDFKYGQGIIVEVEDNPQLMYYAYGLLLDNPEVHDVELRIIQPRGFHPDGPVRLWRTTASYIGEWAEAVLLPAMHRTELDDTLDAGPWCRFCPAKLVCPLLTSLFGAACTANPKHIPNLNDESLGRSFQYVQAVKFYLKAMEEETFRRLNYGKEIAGVKLVNKKANRVWKADAVEAIVAVLGADAYTKPEFKSPPAIEACGARAKKLVHEYAYTPAAGLTVALQSDKRAEVKVSTSSEAFKDFLKNQGSEA